MLLTIKEIWVQGCVIQLKGRNLRTSLWPSSVHLNSPDRTHSKNLVLLLTMQRDSQWTYWKGKKVPLDSKFFWLWSRIYRIMFFVFLKKLFFCFTLYQSWNNFSSESIKMKTTYSKCKVRSVERIACFNSCIMLLYSLEQRLAKILWPCEKMTLSSRQYRHIHRSEDE